MLPPVLHASATPQLQDFLEHTAARLPEKVALVARDQRLTYAQLDRQANALARALQLSGVERGDRVLLFFDNTPEAIISFWAALKANAVPSLVSAQTRKDKLVYYLDDMRAKALVTDSQLRAVWEPSLPGRTHLSAVIVSGANVEMNAPPVPVQSWREAIDRGAAQGDGPPRRANLDLDLAALIYTSGSTGDPKGVMLTHRNMLTAGTSITTYLQMQEDDVVLCAIPLAFDYGLYQMLMSFKVGARLVLERNFAFPAQVLKVMEHEKVTGFPGVPTMFAMLVELDVSKFDLSSLRYVTNTAAGLPVKHITMLRQLFPQARLYSMYGLTECKRCTYLPPEDVDRKPATVGIAIPNTELWLVDEQDRRVGPNVVGQLVIRGATVMKGYWEKPEATAKKLRPGPLPGEQVLYTGDLCKLDDEGYLTFVGRMDDIIKTRGEKVAPREVENALIAVEGVKEVAVVGVPDPLLGQAVKAFVVLQQGAEVSERTLVVACQQKLEAFMVPKQIEFREGLPKSANGKIDKRGLA
jgi:amino acid adenylation domain-containing protein